MNKKNKLKYNIVLYIVLLLLSIFIFSSFLFIDRKYTVLELILKKPFYKICNNFIKYTYSNNKLSNDVIASKIYYYKSQIKSLKETLNLKDKNDLFLPASVVNKKGGKISNKIEIYSDYKLHNKSPVINSNGLVGFISKTSKNIYEVTLLTNVNKKSNILVSILSSDCETKGVIKQYSNNLFVISDIISKNEIKKGDKVVLAGYDNENYNGLFIGYVLKQENTNYDLTKKIYVKSEVDFNDLLYVLVVDDNDK